jgi:hypothetical protein
MAEERMVVSILFKRKRKSDIALKDKQPPRQKREPYSRPSLDGVLKRAPSINEARNAHGIPLGAR